ncbi:hypothetical protein Tco_0779376 [Tanacetum coccineum]
MHVNNLYQPWRAILSLINQCLTGKTFGSDKPKNPVLQIHNIHRRSESPMHVTGYDLPLGNLKFVPKGEKDEAFGMPIPKELITNIHHNISNIGKWLLFNHKEKSFFKLVDEEEEIQLTPEPHVDDDEYNLQ